VIFFYIMHRVVPAITIGEIDLHFMLKKKELLKHKTSFFLYAIIKSKVLIQNMHCNFLEIF